MKKFSLALGILAAFACGSAAQAEGLSSSAALSQSNGVGSLESIVPPGRGRGRDFDRRGPRRGPQNVVCTARNARGARYQGFGRNINQAQRQALRTCQQGSVLRFSCRIVNCR